MSLNPEGTQLYLRRLTAIVAVMEALPTPILKGRACVLGTLTAVRRRVDTLLVAWDTRAMTDADRRQLALDASTLNWLLDDTSPEFEGIYFDVPDLGSKLSFVEAMEGLKSSLGDAISS
ncbi:hypothetical protein [Asticcacaulis machinosus]|uniref:Uncharacterized protein n=1 Tax=Asticcacaulis machinosus TaxID=2984211 RepID=A0ABT5HH97_9CAUL|nr:hypothetical protein [Asticcacaulis machinosus]MDC7675567.1 hypothetical protein [Asticcacaulis machinosus]